jgi:hypothetical protein
MSLLRTTSSISGAEESWEWEWDGMTTVTVAPRTDVTGGWYESNAGSADVERTAAKRESSVGDEATNPHSSKPTRVLLPVVVGL